MFLVAFGSVAFFFCFLFDDRGNGNGEFGDEILFAFFFLFGEGVFAAEIACTDSRKCTANSSLSTPPFDRSVLIGDSTGDVGTVRT